MIRIVLADDDPTFRQFLSGLLGTAPDVQVLAAAEDGAAAIAAIEQLAPDVAVVDVAMPGMSGLQIARSIRQRGSTVRILLLTMYRDPETVSAAAEAGADGYVSKDDAAKHLTAGIRAVAAGEPYWRP